MSLGINKTYMDVFDVILRDTEFAEIYETGIANGPLTNAEKIRFAQFINKFLALVESIYTVHKSKVGMFLDDYDEAFMLNNPYLQKLLETEVGSHWFKHEAQLTFSEEFLTIIKKFNN